MAGLAEVLEGLARVRAATDDRDEAAVLLGAAGALRQRTGSLGSVADAEVIDAALASCRHGEHTDRVDGGLRRGEELSIAEVDRRDVKVVGLSVDPLDSHDRWARDIEETQGQAHDHLPAEHRTRLRRDPARDRLAPTDREPPQPS